MNRSYYASPDQKRALSLLESLLDRVKDIESEEFKIRAQIQIGYAIWDYNEPRARGQLIDASHNITSIKSQTNQEQHGHDPEDAMFESPRFRLQREALRVIAKRDFDLAETLKKSIDVTADDKATRESTQGESEEQIMHSMLPAASLVNTKLRAENYLTSQSSSPPVNPPSPYQYRYRCLSDIKTQNREKFAYFIKLFFSGV